MYNLKLYNQLQTTTKAGPISIHIEEIEDIFLELSDDGCMIQFTSLSKNQYGEHPTRTLPYLPGLRQDLENLYTFNDGLIDITIFSKFRIEEAILQKIIYRLYQIDIITYSYKKYPNTFGREGPISLRCKIR